MKLPPPWTYKSTIYTFVADAGVTIQAQVKREMETRGKFRYTITLTDPMLRFQWPGGAVTPAITVCSENDVERVMRDVKIIYA